MASFTDHFVALVKTSLSLDMVDGDASITVVDSSYLSAGDSIIIDSDTFLIDSINGNSINVNPQTNTLHSSGAVVSVDDSALDGLTPGTAKKSSIFIDGADANNHTRVWIRRINGYEFPANQSARYSEMIAWPLPGEPMYDERPQSAIDAGWDNDTDEFFMNLKTFAGVHNAVTDAQIKYINMRVESDALANVPMFYKKGGNLVFDNCNIVHRRSHHSYGPFVRMEPAGTNNLKLIRCTYTEDGVNCAIMGVYHTHDFNFVRNVEIIDSEINSDMGIYLHRLGSRNYCGDTTLSIINSTAVFSNSAATVGGEGIYVNGYITVNAKDSTIRTKHLVRSSIENRNYGMPPLGIDIVDSDIESTSHMFYWYSTNYRGHESNGYKKWSFKDSRIIANGHIIYFYRPSDMTIRQYGDIIFKRCTLSATSTMVHMQNHSYVGSLIFVDNDILFAGKIFYSTSMSAKQSIISIRDASFSASLFYGLYYASIDLSNVVINGPITEPACYYNKITANNIYAHGFLGHESYKIENSIIDTNGASDPMPNASSAILRGCTVTSHNSKIGNGKAGQLTFIDCKINGDISHSGVSWRTIFESEVNNKSVPYSSFDMYCKKEISSVFRVGGSDGALMLSSEKMQTTGFISTKDISTDLSIGSSSVAVFFASTASASLLNKKSSIGFRYKKGDGTIYLMPATIEVDTVSSWDGLIEGVTRYKASADIVNNSNAIGDDKKVVLELQYSPDIDDIDNEIYLDMNIKSE